MWWNNERLRTLELKKEYPISMDKIIKNLRDGGHLRFFDRKEKLFVQIQLNKKEKRICWERWVSKDKLNWVNWNYYLNLRSVLQVVEQLTAEKRVAN